MPGKTIPWLRTWNIPLSKRAIMECSLIEYPSTGIASAHVSNQRCDENVAKNCSFHVSQLFIARRNHLCRSRRELCKFTCSCQDLSNIYLKASQSCQQSSIQPIRSWYQELVSWNGGINGMSAGSPVTPSSPDRSRLVKFTLDYTWLARSKTNREPVRRLSQKTLTKQLCE